VHRFTNENLAAQRGHLRVAFETKVIVPLHQHLVRNRPVRLVTDRATFAQRFVMENHRARLFAMTLRATFIQRRETTLRTHPQRCAVRCFVNVAPVRIVALDTIHSAFKNRVVLRQFELRVDVQMTIEARLRVASGIDDQSSPASGLQVQAPRPVTGLAPGVLALRRSFKLQSRVRIARERPCKIGVALRASFVANKGRSLNLWRRNRAFWKR
jgi:hypothetical protein